MVITSGYNEGFNEALHEVRTRPRTRVQGPNRGFDETPNDALSRAACKMLREGLEPETPGLEGRCSVQLSYECEKRLGDVDSHHLISSVP